VVLAPSAAQRAELAGVGFSAEALAVVAEDVARGRRR
jgi:hypothetical protein